MAEPFANFQLGIYLQGLSGVRPDLPIAYADLEARAREQLTPEAYGYIAGGAGSEDTMRANLAAFQAWRLLPSMLRDVSTREVGVELLGHTLPAPVLLAPVGVQSIAHPDGELATARAAASLGLTYTLSTASSYSIEEVAEASGDGPRWFQLYWPREPELAASFLQRAEKAGYSAVVVTLDTWLLAWRPRDLANAYLPFLAGVGVANYFTDPVFLAGLERPPEEDLGAAVMRWASVYSDPSVSWENLAFLRQATRLPILLKGILSADDARQAVAAGVDGVIVSNHGGRQVDGAIATLAALPDVVAAVPAGFPVLLDSGVRTGADVVKAVALGARAVLVGRPYMWGLALAGDEGVRHVLQCLLAEMDLTLALCGRRSIADLKPDVLRPSG